MDANSKASPRIGRSIADVGHSSMLPPSPNMRLGFGDAKLDQLITTERRRAMATSQKTK